MKTHINVLHHWITPSGHAHSAPDRLVIICISSLRPHSAQTCDAPPITLDFHTGQGMIDVVARNKRAQIGLIAPNYLPCEPHITRESSGKKKLDDMSAQGFHINHGITEVHYELQKTFC
ncbi:hypothetical protein [Alteromonas sp. ASW11-130]|uniref:hypothetical protein n=1 Tax=Alteromonas sp. ASW11-130 TaxID=3015775 RepID=UPI00224285DD|nr:hypothetical protein [Alteromonas sp. ASW11-130]MCW8092333.1 hypothetical protein [Alteromonas sp. ASW11-130]